ncbi:Major facilitator superfamily domain [Phytophthora cactorum]|nr:Major facilitator superfamily domain [Phytophthora cactorum]
MVVTRPHPTRPFGCCWQYPCLNGDSNGVGSSMGCSGSVPVDDASTYAVQITQFIGPIAGVLVAPSVGVFSDRSTMKMGRRRPFLIVAGILSIVCWIAMGYTREMGEALGDHGDGTDGEETDRNNGRSSRMAWATLGAILIAGYIEFFGAAYKTLHWFMGMLSVPLLAIYWVAFFFVQYGYTAYNGNKGQFFGLEVYGGVSENADSCDPCSAEQDAYNHGVSVAGGRADLLYNVVGYVWAWALPFMVHKIGVKWVLTISTVPQVLYTAMAWTSSPGFNVFVVAVTGITHAVWFTLVVPVIIHVFGRRKTSVSMWEHSTRRTALANCLTSPLARVFRRKYRYTSVQQGPELHHSREDPKRQIGWDYVLDTDVEKGYDIQNSPKPGIKEGSDEQGSLSHPPIWLLLAVSMPRMAINMAWSAQWAALGPYLSTMLPNFAVQITQFIGPIVGVLVGPSIGVLSDRSTSNYTRAMGEALGDHGDGTDGQPTDRTWTSILTVFFYLWMDITVNVVQTPAMLLVADFAGDRQTTGAALGQAWSTLGSILVAGYIELFGAAHKTLHEFMWMLSATIKVDAVSTWKRIGHAFASVYHGIRTLPGVLAIYGVCFFFVQYGYTAYNGNKGQFFGLEVYDGSAENADSCDPCTPEQDAYNHGVSIAGGRADLLFNIVGYVYSWTLPFLVHKFGVKVGSDALDIPQIITQAVWFALIVPVIIHVFGEDEEIGIYVGALNSANCFGQLLNFAIGSGLVETSLGYKLPVFLGGIMSALGFITALLFFKMKMKMYSM